MRYLTPLKRAEGLGSAHSGTQSHWAMTVSAVALAILTPFFIGVVGSALGKPQDMVLQHFSHPFAAIVTGLFIVLGMLHFIRGTRMTIEDYLQGTARKIAIIASVLFGWAVIAAAIYALVRMALIGMMV